MNTTYTQKRAIKTLSTLARYVQSIMAEQETKISSEEAGRRSGTALRRECLNWAFEKWGGTLLVDEGRDAQELGTGMRLHDLLESCR